MTGLGETPSTNPAGSCETPTTRMAVVPLDSILRLLEDRSAAIDADADAVEANRPDPLSSPAAKTLHAGQGGIVAGRRQELNLLSELLADQATEVLVVPVKPPNVIYKNRD